MGKFILITIVLALTSWTHSAPIDCEPNHQCKKISLFYQEIGCKAIKTSKSCCPKRFECPDFKKSDDDAVNLAYMRRGCLPVFRADKETRVDWKCPTADVVSHVVEADSLLVKKIVKRQSPSQNYEAYLHEVRSLDDDYETTTQQQVEADTSTDTLVPLPTLSVDPFIAPFEFSTMGFFIKLDETSTTPSRLPITTEFSDDSTITPRIASFEETSTEKFTTNQLVESDFTTSTTTVTAEQIPTTTPAAKTTIKDIVNEKIVATTTDSSIDAETIPSQSRDLLFLNLPQPLSAVPFKPPVIAASSETVRATPTELNAILAALREILTHVETIAKRSTKDHGITASNFQSRKRRSIEEKTIDEAKQKFVNIKGCSFNGKLFKVGEKITSVEDSCLECYCEYAPIGHCILKQECSL